MESITLDAPCKINLSLDIAGRHPNGYHEMDMVMQSISLYDTLSLKLVPGSGQIRMTCTLENSSASLACDESNIAVRCARAFLEETKLSLNQQDLEIFLQKRIPMMAGLGGGSADGAGVLCGLNKLLDTKLSCEALEKIGLKCGADIPFCVRGGTLRAQGIGEIFTPVPAMPDCFIAVIKPNFGISTKDAFSRCDTYPYRHADVSKMLSALSHQDVKEIASSLENVFEELCSPAEQELLQKVHALLQEHHALGSLLSGSGSAVFGIFEDEKSARDCVLALSAHPMVEGAFLCRPVSGGAYSSVKNAIL